MERHKEKGDEFLNFADFYDMVAAKASKEFIGVQVHESVVYAFLSATRNYLIVL